MDYNSALKALFKLRSRGRLTQKEYVHLIKQAKKKYLKTGEITPKAVATKREEPDIKDTDSLIEFFGKPLDTT